MSFTVGSDAPSAEALRVTTGRDPQAWQEERARQLAGELGGRFVPRGAQSLKRLLGRRPEGLLLVVERHRLTLHVGEDELFYHPGMAIGRIRRLREGRSDPMVDAMQLQPGDRVLDATLGLASDALVAAFGVGPRGEVVGLERVAVLAVLVREGLRDYPWPDAELAQAARRIQVVAADHLPWLSQAPDRSFDVVYFDAMFERPLSGAVSMALWRKLAWEAPVSPEALAQARRVARRCVVLKDRKDSSRLRELNPPRLFGGRASRLVYGVWPADG